MLIIKEFGGVKVKGDDRDLSFLPFILASELLFVSEGILIFYKNKKTRGTKGPQKVSLGWRRRGEV